MIKYILIVFLLSDIRKKKLYHIFQSLKSDLGPLGVTPIEEKRVKEVSVNMSKQVSTDSIFNMYSWFPKTVPSV